MNPDLYFDLMTVAVETLWKDYNLKNPGSPLDCDFESGATRRLVIVHDYLHVLLSCGFTVADEEIVAAVETCLSTGNHWNPEIVKLVSNLPTEYVAIYKS
jgi:hypothetical protein